VVANTLTVAFKARNYEVIGQMLPELKSCMNPAHPRYTLIFAIYLLYKTAYDVRDGIEESQLVSLESFLRSAEDDIRIDAKINIRFLLAQCYSHLKMFTKAKEHLSHTIDNDGKSYVYEERQTLFRLLYLIAFYEELASSQSQDYAFFHSSVKSFYERIRKDKEYFALELTFVKFFKGFYATIPKKEHKTLLGNLESELNALFISPHPFYRHIKHDYDFQKWVGDKLI
jgi:tetratricopeptide (TPR) repeat protein